MVDELSVDINREGKRELDVPASIEVVGSFDIRFVNHGEALHVHLNANDALSRVITVDAGNRHVPGNGERRVHVDVNTDVLDGDAVEGKLEVATSYGAEQQWIDVVIKDPDSAHNTVQVDEDLAAPTPERRSYIDRPELFVLGLGVIAVIVVALVWLVLDAPVVATGAAVVAGGVLVALVFLLRSRIGGGL